MWAKWRGFFFKQHGFIAENQNQNTSLIFYCEKLYRGTPWMENPTQESKPVVNLGLLSPSVCLCGSHPNAQSLTPCSGTQLCHWLHGKTSTIPPHLHTTPHHPHPPDVTPARQLRSVGAAKWHTLPSRMRWKVMQTNTGECIWSLSDLSESFLTPLKRSLEDIKDCLISV